MPEIWTMGELLCEIMRPQEDMPLNEPGIFRGPFPSGAPAIFIDTAARLGHTTGIVGGIGNDDFGKCLLNRLRNDGVDCSQITTYDDGSTGVAFVTYFSNGDRRFLYHFSDTPATRAKAPHVDLLGGDTKYFHIMGCSLTAKQEFGHEILKLMRDLSAKGTEISFDPNIRPELLKNQSAYGMVKEVMLYCNIFLPGVSELLTISGKKNVEEAVKSCFKNPALKIIAVKNGSKGCTVYTRDKKTRFGVYPVAAIDATGAGDSFDGAFLCGLMENMPIEDTVKFAAAAAALNTAAFGPMEGDISRKNILKMISESNMVYH